MRLRERAVEVGPGQSPYGWLVSLALLQVLGTSFLGARDNALVISVKVLDHDSGVPIGGSEILLLPDDEFLEDTSEDGRAQVECERGSRIKAVDPARRYWASRPERCLDEGDAAELTFRLQSVRSTAELQAQLAVWVKEERFALAAQAANELRWVAYDELRDEEEVIGRQAEILALSFTGKVLNVEESVQFDELQGREVMTPELRVAILAFQEKRGIPESGKVDLRTLVEMTGVTSGALRSGVGDWR